MKFEGLKLKTIAWNLAIIASVVVALTSGWKFG